MNYVVKGMAAIDLMVHAHFGNDPLTPKDLKQWKDSLVRKVFNKPLIINGKELKGTQYIFEDIERPVYTEEELREYAAGALSEHYSWVHDNYGAITAHQYYEFKKMDEYGVEKKEWPLCNRDLIEDDDDDENINDDDDADCMNFQCNLFCPYFEVKGCTYENYL